MTAAPDEKTAAILFSHGTVENLEDLTAFVTNIRRGHAPPRDVVDELVRRYRAIGGRSPLGDITRELCAAVERRVGFPTRMAMRLWHPYPRDVLSELVDQGAERILMVPLAQHSAHVYAKTMEQAVEQVRTEKGKPLELRCAPNWGSRPDLVMAFAGTIRRAIAELPEAVRSRTTLVMTAHSLPVSVIQAGDPYEREMRKSAELIAAATGDSKIPHKIAFQSQGMGGGTWLGPDLQTTLDAIAAEGNKHALFAPVGFLSDHVEVLYDLDIEAMEWARARGLTTSRAASLNASAVFVDVIAGILEELRP